MTLNDRIPYFKDTPFFDAEYLRNGATVRELVVFVPAAMQLL